MGRRKHTISQTGMDELMERLTKIAQEDLDPSEGDELLGAEITSDFVKKLTKVESIEEVIDRNEQLTEHFQGLLSMYGFETMYDMYMYALSCDDLSETVQKSKDYSKLVPVKRKVVRNGKEHEVTVWVKPYGDSDEDDTGDEEGGRGRKGKARTQTSRRNRSESLSTDGAKSSEDYGLEQLAQLKQLSEKFPNGNKPFQDGSTYYLELRDDSGEVVGVIGYVEDGEFLKLDFYRTNGKVPGVATRGFFELLKLGVAEGKGVKVDDVPQARQVFVQSGLEFHDDGYWFISAKELKQLLDFDQHKEPMNE